MPSETAIEAPRPALSGVAVVATGAPGLNVRDLFGTVRAVLSALLCAGFTFVLTTYPDPSTKWGLSAIGFATVTMFAPLALLVWSVVARPSWRSPALRWTRIFIFCHFVAVALVLMMFLLAFPVLALLSAVLSVPIPGMKPVLDFFYSPIAGVLPIVYAAYGGVGALTDLPMLALGPPASSSPAVLSVYRRSLLTLCFAVIGALFAWSFATIGLVTWQAEEVAGEQRYCMMVPIDAEDDYRPVASLFELRGLKLRAPVIPGILGAPGSRLSSHLLLIVASHADPEYADNGDETGLSFWHWSHRQRRFIAPESRPAPVEPSASMGVPAPRSWCAPSAHFIGHLPMFSPW